MNSRSGTSFPYGPNVINTGNRPSALGRYRFACRIAPSRIGTSAFCSRSISYRPVMAIPSDNAAYLATANRRRVRRFELRGQRLDRHARAFEQLSPPATFLAVSCRGDVANILRRISRAGRVGEIVGTQESRAA